MPGKITVTFIVCCSYSLETPLVECGATVENELSVVLRNEIDLECGVSWEAPGGDVRLECGEI